MHQISDRVFVGAQTDFDMINRPWETEWPILHAARDPWHRQLLGYAGRGAPKEHPEYLFARRENRLYLNLLDVHDPKYVSTDVIDEAMRFLHEQVERLTAAATAEQILICCNQGRSRAPTIGMLWLAPDLPADFEVAEDAYREVCPVYMPGVGMREFARAHWERYRAREWLGGAVDGGAPDLLDKAEQIWQTFCRNRATNPAVARGELIQSIVSLVQASSAAEQAGRLTNGEGHTSSSPG